MQNIPIRTEIGKQLRKVFVAPEGSKFIDADYSQIELRILAHISGDENMINAFSVCGTPKDISDKINQMEELGINEFVVGSPIGKDRMKSLKLLEDIINSFN